ncbi:uncharacterized protein LOC116430617 [Nomia melanderi]|uniref:uncharacterized protein LOC116430617 n=1 Tax=Nomia melanderi TaxID=2448451 RepID=UPI003FCC7A4F
MTVDHLLSFTENEKRKIMKWLVLLAFVAIAAAELSPQRKAEPFLRKVAELFEVTMDDVQNCVNTTKTTEEDILHAAHKGNNPYEEYKRISCLIACCAKKQGMMAGMEVNVPVIIDFVVKYQKFDTTDELKKLRRTLIACNERVTEANECDAIYQVFVCTYLTGLLESLHMLFTAP